MTVALDPVAASPVNTAERKDMGLRSGDTVRVHQKIQEKGKTRIQVFEGLVIAKKHGSEPGATFTVRATLSGVGVEKIFPLYSPLIDKIEVIRRSKVRRAKLYYIRDKVAREIRKQLRNMKLMSLATESGREVEEREALAQKEAEEKAVTEKAVTELTEKEVVEKAAEKTTTEPTAEPEPTPEGDGEKKEG